MPDTASPNPVTPTVFYRDPLAALKWLEAAFGLETTMLVTDQQGRVGHAEMTWRGAPINIGAEFESEALLGPARMRSPASLDGAGSQFIRLGLESDIDGHCRRAAAAGARITRQPADEFYGSRVYRALDPEGHVWNFEQPGAEVSVEEMEKATGLKIKSSL